MMILKEQWLIVTDKNKITTGDFNGKLNIKQRNLTFKAWEHLEQGRDLRKEIAELDLKRNTN